MRLAADVTASDRHGQRNDHAFEVPVMIVSPVMLSNPALTVGDLNFNEQPRRLLFTFGPRRASNSP